jgi:hypothetical protein
MRTFALVLCVLFGCAAADDDGLPEGERRIEFLVPGTLDPLPENAAVETYLRTQGDYGTEIDMRVYGVAIEDQAMFTIACIGADDHELAAQMFLPTSTARELDDGSFVVVKMPVVFFEDVATEEVSDAPATLRATMMTAPPTLGELAVTLDLKPAD